MIYFGDRFRLGSPDGVWLLEERPTSKAPWNPPQRHTSLRSAMTAIVEESMRASAEHASALTVRQALDRWQSNLYAAMTYFFVVAELAAPELQRRWEALGLTGVPALLADVTDEQLSEVEKALPDDDDVQEVVDLAQNVRGMMKLLGGP